MNQDKVLKIIKGLNRFSPDDIEVMTDFCEAETQDIIEKFLSDGLITKLSELEYSYVNKIPERRGIFRLIEKPQVKAIPDKNINFQQAAEYFLTNYVLQNCTTSTYKTYNSSIKSHLTMFFGKMDLNCITQQDIKNFIGVKLQEKLSDKNIRNCVTLLGTMFNKFIEWGLILESPYNGIINVKARIKPNIKVLKETEVNHLLKILKTNCRNTFIITLLILSTGLKKVEILGLKKQDIDLKNQKISINKTLFEGKILPLRTKTAIRQVDIPENIIPELKKSIRNKQSDDFIFYDMSTSYYTQDKCMRHQFRIALNQLNIDQFKFDNLRHTFAYNALQRGMSIDYLHKQLGDYSIQATMDRYRDFIV